MFAEVVNCRARLRVEILFLIFMFYTSPVFLYSAISTSSIVLKVVVPRKLGSALQYFSLVFNLIWLLYPDIFSIDLSIRYFRDFQLRTQFIFLVLYFDMLSANLLFLYHLVAVFHSILCTLHRFQQSAVIIWCNIFRFRLRYSLLLMFAVAFFAFVLVFFFRILSWDNLHFQSFRDRLFVKRCLVVCQLIMVPK